MKQKKLSTRMLSLVLTVAMVGTLLPATVFAAEGDTPAVTSGTTTTPRTTSLDLVTNANITYIGTDGSTSKTANPTTVDITDTGEGWAWDHTSKTLTLNGANISLPDSEDSECNGVCLPAGATVELANENSIRISAKNADCILSGVYDEGNLTVGGTGSLTLITDNTGTNYGLQSEGGTITINGGTFNIHSDHTGVWANDGITINGGTITSQGNIETSIGKIAIKDGYTLMGNDDEFTNKDMTSIPFDPKGNPPLVVTFTPVVAFAPSNGAIIDTVPVVGDKITIPANPTWGDNEEKNNYTFAGWYTGQDYTTPFANKGLTTSVMLYAKWTVTNGKTVRTIPLHLEGMSSADKLATDGWKWDAGTKTLSLDGATMHVLGEYCYAVDRESNYNELPKTTITIESQGINTLISENGMGVLVQDNLIFKGDGALRVEGSFTGASATGNVTVESGDVTAVASGDGEEILGLASGGNMTVSGGTLLATGLPADPESSMGVGMQVENDLIITGGNVTAKGSAFAAKLANDFTAEGAVVTGSATVDGTMEPVQFQMNDEMCMFVPVLASDGATPAKHVNFSSNGSKSVSFDARNGGAAIPSAEISEGGTITLPTNPTWGDYSFAGWYTEIDGKGTEFVNDKLSANTTVYAKWTKDGKTVRTEALDLTKAVTAAADQGWTWAGNTLTLDGATIDCSGNAAANTDALGIKLPDKAKIVLDPNSINTVKAGNTSGTSTSNGIYFVGNEDTRTSSSISGKGTLNVAAGASVADGASFGILCTDATLTFSDATVYTSSTKSNMGGGIGAYLDVQSGTITATGTGTSAGFGINTPSMTMSGGTVTATGSGVPEGMVCGIMAVTLDMTGGTLSASGTTAAVMAQNPITAADGANVTGANETFASGTTKDLTQSGAEPVVISFISKSDYTGTDPLAPVADSKTDTSITLKAQDITGETVQYGIDKDNNGTITWQDGTTFDGLTAGTKYKFYTCVKANTIHKAGIPSVATEITTKKAPASVSGNVKDSTNKNVSGAKVALTPSNPALTATTGADGNYSFARVPEGVYSLVVTNGTGADKITITEIVIVAEAPITGKNIILLSGNKSTVVETKPNTPPTAADKLKDLFDPAKVGENEDDSKGITKTDLTTVTNGGSVTVTLTSTKKTEEEVQTDAGEIKKKAAGEELLFLDFAVTKVVKQSGDAEGAPIKMTELPAVVEIVVEIPEALRNAATISVYRTHDGVTTKFATKADANGEYAERRGNYMHVFAKYFSTYAMGYNTGGGSTGGDGSATITYPNTVNKPQNGTVTTNPASPFEGQTVTITTKPDAGYVVDTIIVKDADGKTIAVTKNGENSYSFVQPGNKVTVEVTYKKPGTKTFTDVTANDWFYNAVMEATANGWFSGTSATTFDPYASTTRGMIATVLQRVDSTPKATTASFDDVAPDAYYASGIAWAQANNIVVGYGDGNYGPNDNITREQLAAILYHYAGYKGYDLSKRATLDSFTDGKNVSDYAKEAMSWAVGSGLISGRGNNILAPTATATRAEVAAILVRFDELFTK